MSSPKIDMLLSKPIEIPPIAVPINVTATMPMITPSAVSVERVRFERICAAAIFQLSPSSQRKRFIVDLTPPPPPRGAARTHARHFQLRHRANELSGVRAQRCPVHA